MNVTLIPYPVPCLNEILFFPPFASLAKAERRR